mmetsp:Transcript_7295/g.19540  ORF Transcript_7295/g.19540 Transcript_7295/m.19540 type:complete len:80 (-) Transcript_7295:1618-1857(-)
MQCQSIALILFRKIEQGRFYSEVQTSTNEGLQQQQVNGSVTGTSFPNAFNCSSRNATAPQQPGTCRRSPQSSLWFGQYA